jgi:amidase
MGLIGNTSPLNVTGSRVVVLPVGRFREGLPIGVQLVRRRWHDMGLLQVAELVEAQVTGPFRPPAGYSNQPRPTGAVA